MTRTIDCHRRPHLRSGALGFRVPCLALTALALLGLACPGNAQAQEIPKGQVAFKATIKGEFTVFIVPGNPGSFSLRETGKGDSTPLGAFTWSATGIDLIDLETGVSVSGTPAAGAFTGANGDAIYVRYGGGISSPGSTANLVRFEGLTFIVTGGTGRFAGATGSGTLVGEVDIEADKVSLTWQGTITAPKQ